MVRLRDHGAARAHVDHVAEADHQCTRPLPLREGAEGQCIIRLHQPRVTPRQRAADRAHGRRAGRRWHPAANLVVEHQQADLVATLQCHIGQHEAGVDRVFETRAVTSHLRHQPAGIQRDDHRLALLYRVLAHLRAAASSARLPVNVPRIVTGHVRAQRVERHAATTSPDLSHARVAQAMLHRQQPEAAHLRQRRHHRHLIVRRHGADHVHQPQRAMHTHRDRAQRRRTT